MSGATLAALLAVHVVAVVATSLRWLRVAQREHYLPGRTVVFAWRWWTIDGAARVLGAIAVAVAMVAPIVPGEGAALVAAASLLLVLVGPPGLSPRGRTSPLAWTRRLRVVAGTTLVLSVGLAAAAVAVDPALLALAAVVHPVLVDLALAIDRPVEDVLARRWLDRAAERVRRVAPAVVGITGSYGKTTTKNYVAHLMGRSVTVLPSRRSFNNRLGLARSVNQDLQPGTDWFIAEMGTYGPGEIAELVSWLPPRIAVMTAIGPVHLERMGSLDNILRAKREITVPAGTVVLNVDDERLRALAPELEAEGKRVVRAASDDEAADVVVRVVDGRLRATVDGVVAEAPLPEATVVPVNVACALGVCLAAGVLPPSLDEALASLPAVDNRLTVDRTPDGPVLLDDTYNANPAGARVALARAVELRDEAGSDRIVVVTPGMVELGPTQHDENAALGAAVADLGGELVVVGRTNARALRDGYAGAAGRQPTSVADRDGAVAWIRDHVGPGDVVLFENDLPDHFP